MGGAGEKDEMAATRRACRLPVSLAVQCFFFFLFLSKFVFLLFSFSCWSWFLETCHDISAWSFFMQHEYFFCSLKDFSKKLYWNQE